MKCQTVCDKTRKTDGEEAHDLAPEVYYSVLTDLRPLKICQIVLHNIERSIEFSWLTDAPEH